LEAVIDILESVQDFKTKIDKILPIKCDEIIKKSYIQKAKVCHPDKHPGKPEVQEIFELITRAYDILKDEKTRNSYNNKLKLNKQSSGDFTKLKKGATEYVESIGQYLPPNDQQKLSFKEKMKELDSKHGYDSSIESIAIGAQDAKKKMNELNKIRAVQDLQLKPEKLFDEGRFDIQKFNAAFDMVHKRDDGTIIQHNGVPSAWNDMGTVANYSSFDTLGNLYVEDNNRFDTSKQIFGSIDFAEPNRKITKDDL
jgi:curved DNA-binding protein CbpA